MIAKTSCQQCGGNFIKNTWLILGLLCVVGISGNSQINPYDFTPLDPWRVIDGTTNYAKGNDWVEFAGKVLEVQPSKGIRLEGNFNRIGSGATIYFTGNYADNNYEFFVANFPYDVAEGDIISVANRFTARKTSTYTYKTTAGGSRTIRQIDYGTPYVPPPARPLTPEQIAAAKAKAEASKKSGAAAALKSNQDAAAKGDAYGLMRMGERYRDGDGVEKDLAKAKEYLQKAADAGSPTAKDELSKLNQP